jgi:hypothetical protein
MTFANNLLIITSIEIILIMINISLFNIFDKLTNKTKYIGKMPIYFGYFGIFMFPFYKIIRKHKTLSGIKRTVKEYENFLITHKKHNNPYEISKESDFYKEYLSFKRYLQLRKLKKKI